MLHGVSTARGEGVQSGSDAGVGARLECEVQTQPSTRVSVEGYGQRDSSIEEIKHMELCQDRVQSNENAGMTETLQV